MLRPARLLATTLLLAAPAAAWPGLAGAPPIQLDDRPEQALGDRLELLVEEGAPLDPQAVLAAAASGRLRPARTAAGSAPACGWPGSMGRCAAVRPAPGS